MTQKTSHNLFNIVIAFAMTMFFSCKNNFKEVQQIGVLQNEPIGIAENMNLKYTDSGRLKANLISSKMLDFSNREFSYNEFPDGILLNLYDERNKKSVIVADYAIVYNDTDLIDLRGNVLITTETKDSIFAQQLFYDQKRDWVFSNKPIKYVSPTKIVTGNAFDSSRDFTSFGISEVTSTVYLDEDTSQ
ncbi:LPS export ABC transporter periplasmic protein LptC [Gelidibacter salicanalis]|uniref:LPS export ABC transporter periplasmic protein LptC n=1 Tax=Gelidibacter salicanalis TaxID=291193 RepID=A0A934NKI6_9FLAO|nr:LPS export ABC transporter periplasmic protein LptC [Gelidibacter salicanalis]MBJ7880787.1 LPS export ABC transporter periplasmic protein LptC [Gelidibacter salicanalis]